MRHLRGLLALLLAATTLAAAACGGGGGAGAGTPESATFVPVSTAAFVTLNTDFESEQWRDAEALLQRFPGGAEALGNLDELKTSVGPEVGIAILEIPVQGGGGATEPDEDGDVESSDDPPVLLVTKPEDPAALEASLRESADQPVWRVVDGWYVVASDQGTLDAAASAAPLADDPVFGEVMDELPGDAVARLFLSGAAIGQTLGQGLEDNPLSGLLGGLAGANASTGLGLSARAEAEGARIDGVIVGDEIPEAESFDATLGSLVPADALAYAAFHDVRPGLEALLDALSAQNSDFDQQLGQIQLVLGVSLTDDVLPLFEGEHALFVRAGAPIPEVTLILSPADPQRALATLDKLTSGLPALAGLAGGDVPFTVTPTTIAGLPVKQVDIAGQDLSLFYALVGEHLVVTTAAKGIADVAAPSTSIESDPQYQAATDAADLPDETSGLVYVNLRDAVSLLESLAAQAGETVTGAPTALNPVLTSLQYGILYGEGGQPQRFTGFVGIG
jgi:hypothetical protein